MKTIDTMNMYEKRQISSFQNYLPIIGKIEINGKTILKLKGPNTDDTYDNFTSVNDPPISVQKKHSKILESACMLD